MNELKKPDLICLSHLRWNFVWQRPQHLLSRFAREQRVFFVEEPVVTDETETRLDVTTHESGVVVVVPQIEKSRWESGDGEPILRELFDGLFEQEKIEDYFFWYYTPMALEWTKHKQPQAIIYDAMDELSAFKNPPPQLLPREQELYKFADLVFTGGESIYEFKKDKHPKVFCFPSSIETAHFAAARNITDEPADQRTISHPRLGFFGVVDERFDIDLLGKTAALKPDWQFVIIGPVVKIDEQDLPRSANIHYLGGKTYQELPSYIAGWGVALLLFALNDSTKFISPTKTPEYLAAGAPVVSTPIRDVVRPYGDMNLVHIAETPEGFVQSCESALNEDHADRIARADEFLKENSWDKTHKAMADLITEAIDARRMHDKSIGNVVDDAKVVSSHGRI